MKSKVADIHALLDSGARGNFIHPDLALTLSIPQQRLPKPLKALNVDGTPNKKGTITHFIIVDILVNNRLMTLELMIAGIGQSSLILGFPWLQTWNPDVDWKHGTLAWRKEVPVAPDISAERPTTTLINLISKTTCKGLGLAISLASPICPQKRPIMEPVKPFSIITDVETSFHLSQTLACPDKMFRGRKHL